MSRILPNTVVNTLDGLVLEFKQYHDSIEESIITNWLTNPIYSHEERWEMFLKLRSVSSRIANVDTWDLGEWSGVEHSHFHSFTGALSDQDFWDDYDYWPPGEPHSVVTYIEEVVSQWTDGHFPKEWVFTIPGEPEPLKWNSPDASKKARRYMQELAMKNFYVYIY